MPLLRLSDASRRLGCEYNRLFRLVASGKVPAQRSPGGGRWLIAEDDLPEIVLSLRVSLEPSPRSRVRS